MTDVAETRIYHSRYEIVRQLARGGMAEVYLARDLQLHRSVALKVLFRELSTDQAFVQRFRHEAQAAANLSHPNIVSVYDWGESEADSTYFIVMEYVDGDPLSKIIRTRGPLDPHRAAEIGADIASALSYAHAHGVIHRDVKPGNVLVTHEGTAKVTDFGIARGHNTDVSLTQTGAVMGTATYFSPEQAQGERVDARSDIYSLGVVLYEMVVGRPPFSGDNPIAIATKHVRELPTAPTALDPTIPTSFEAVVMKAMSKDPEDRYQSAEELQVDLHRFNEGRKVVAPAFDPSVTAFYEGGAAATVVSRREPRTRISPPSGNGNATPPQGLPPSEPRRSGSRVAMMVVALVVLAVLLGIGSYAVVKSINSGTGSSFDVPDVQGMGLTRAESKLVSLGLVAKVTYASSARTRGSVVDQSPPYPTPVPRGSTVTLTVSKGGQAEVPDLLGSSVQSATTTLKEDDFTVQVAKETIACTQVGQYATPPNIGDVIKETPSGTTAPLGSPVTLTVSEGVVVPTVTNESEADASNQLGQCGFTLGTTTPQPSPTGQSIPEGFVISTSPDGGTWQDPGATVSLTVSSGAGVVVPSVVGDTLSQAESAISNLGLTYTINPEATSTTCQADTVCSQSPAAGTTVNSASNVSISEGQNTPPTTTSSTSTTMSGGGTSGTGGGTGSGGGPPTTKKR